MDGMMLAQEFARKTVRMLCDEVPCARHIAGLGNRLRVVVVQQAYEFFAMHVCSPLRSGT